MRHVQQLKQGLRALYDCNLEGLAILLGFPFKLTFLESLDSLEQLLAAPSNAGHVSCEELERNCWEFPNALANSIAPVRLMDL